MPSNFSLHSRHHAILFPTYQLVLPMDSQCVCIKPVAENSTFIFSPNSKGQIHAVSSGDFRIRQESIMYLDLGNPSPLLITVLGGKVVALCDTWFSDI